MYSLGSYSDYLKVVNSKSSVTPNEMCYCGHRLSDHNNADSCSKFMECGCNCFEPVEEL